MSKFKKKYLKIARKLNKMLNTVINKNYRKLDNIMMSNNKIIIT